MILTKLILAEILSNTVAEEPTSPLADAVVGLFTDVIGGVISEETKLTDLTLADAAGCEPQPVVWSLVFDHAGSTMQEIQGTSLEFRPTDDLKTNHCKGLFLADAVEPTKIFGVEMFSSNKSLHTPADALVVIPRVGLDSKSSYGSSVVAD